MERWGWGLRGPGSAPGEPEHRASGPGHGELGQGHRGTGTSIGTWSNQDTGDQDKNMVLRQGHRRPGPRAGDEEQETVNRMSVEGSGQGHRRLRPGQDRVTGTMPWETGTWILGTMAGTWKIGTGIWGHPKASLRPGRDTWRDWDTDPGKQGRDVRDLGSRHGKNRDQDTGTSTRCMEGLEQEQWGRDTEGA